MWARVVTRQVDPRPFVAFALLAGLLGFLCLPALDRDAGVAR
jgi:hypothetical protein